MTSGIFAVIGFVVARLLDYLSESLRRDEAEAAQRVIKIEHAIALVERVLRELDEHRNTASTGPPTVIIGVPPSLAPLQSAVEVWAPALKPQASSFIKAAREYNIRVMKLRHDVLGVDIPGQLAMVRAFLPEHEALYQPINKAAAELLDALAFLAREHLPTARPSMVVRLKRLVW